MTSIGCDCPCHPRREQVKVGDRPSEEKEAEPVLQSILDFFETRNPDCDEMIPMDELKIHPHEFASALCWDDPELQRDVQIHAVWLYRCRQCWILSDECMLRWHVEEDVPLEHRSRRMRRARQHSTL